MTDLLFWLMVLGIIGLIVIGLNLGGVVDLTVGTGPSRVVW